MISQIGEEDEIMITHSWLYIRLLRQILQKNKVNI